MSFLVISGGLTVTVGVTFEDFIEETTVFEEEGSLDELDEEDLTIVTLEGSEEEEDDC